MRNNTTKLLINEYQKQDLVTESDVFILKVTDNGLQTISS